MHCIHASAIEARPDVFQCAIEALGKFPHIGACDRCQWKNKQPTEQELAALRLSSTAEPTITDLASHFTEATAKWAKAGFPVVSPDEYARRAGICEACEYWDGKARLGLGKCTHGECGCSRFKRWLATEQCPKGKWETPTLIQPEIGLLRST